MGIAKSLHDITVLSFESRMSDATAKLLQRQGVEPVSAPSLQEVPLENHGAVFQFAQKLLADEVDILICTTGVGIDMMIKTLKTRYDLTKVLQKLREITIVSRGPKPAKVLRKLDIPIEVKVPEPNTWNEIIQAMAHHTRTSDLKGKKIAIQEYGESNESLNKELQKQGGELLQVPIYRWSLPEDLGPLENGIQKLIHDEIDAVLFTSKTQVKHVMKVAEKFASVVKVRKALNNTWVASIGPVCSRGLKSYGIEVDFEPSRPKLAIFIKEMVKELPKHVQ